jgi:hypothetical protein
MKWTNSREKIQQSIEANNRTQAAILSNTSLGTGAEIKRSLQKYDLDKM